MVPPDDLARYISRFFIFAVESDASGTFDDVLLNESPTVTIPLSGRWSWSEGGDDWHAFDAPILFGPRVSALHIRADGHALVAGFAIRPCGWPAFDPRPASAIADLVEPLSARWAWVGRFGVGAHDATDPDAINVRLQAAIRARIARGGTVASDRAAAFEALVRSESNIPVKRAADELGMNSARFDRFVRQYFGHPPKVVLRRSRFLDMAGVMRGVACPEISAVAPVQFYDASHLNREFRDFLDMTPGAFARAHTPFLNVDLAARCRGAF